MKILRFLLIFGAASAALFFSCAAPVEGFVFRDQAGTGVGLTAESRKGLAGSGGVLLRPGESVVFLFKKPVTVDGEGLSLYLKTRGPGEGLTVSAFGKDRRKTGGPAASAPLPGLPGEAEFHLRLPPGVYGGFAFRRAPAAGADGAAREAAPGKADGKNPAASGDGEALRILEAGIRKHRREASVSAAGVVAASDLNLVPGGKNGFLRFDAGGPGAEGGTVLAVTVNAGAEAGRAAEIGLAGKDGRYSARLLLRPVPETLYFHPPILGFTPETFEIRGLPGGASLDLRAVSRRDWEKGSPVFAPIPVDLRLLAEGRPAWRRQDFEVFSWNLFPEILVFDTKDYRTQNRLFHRLAFFVEKKGYRGSLQPDRVIADRHGWNAHNYSAEGFAAFFEAARRISFPLNEMEVWLREYLTGRGVLRKAGEGYVPGRGGAISVSRQSEPAHRRLLLTHEAFHGAYYMLPDFRRLAEKTWTALPPEQKEFWRFFFSWMQYDVTDPGLVVNEFQAYLLQQPAAAADDYFMKTVTSRLTERYPERKEWFEDLFRRHPGMFGAPARVLSDHLRAATGIRGGDVFSLRPLRE